MPVPGFVPGTSWWNFPSSFYWRLAWALSFAGFKGSAFGNRSQKVISLVCAVMLLGFGVKFVYDAAIGLWGRPIPIP